MKNLKAVLLSLLAFSGLSSYSAFAIDIAPYLVPQPGAWAVYQGASGSLDWGYESVRGNRGEITTKWYDYDNGVWRDDGSHTFLVQRNRLVLVRKFDGTHTWRADRPVRIPRFMNVYEPFFYHGNLVNETTSEIRPYTVTFMITETGISVTTPGGSFTDCVKQKMYSHEGGVSRASTNLLCPNRSEVKNWVSKINDTSDPTDQTQSAFRTEMNEFGDGGWPYAVE